MNILIQPFNRETAASKNTVLLLRDLLHEKTGVFFEDTHLDLMLGKLQPLAAARGLHSAFEYFAFLKQHSQFSEEWRRVLDALAVQETYFWREMDSISTIVNVLVPQWFASSPEPLRIWVAACATGEEPLSLLIALAEAGHGHHPISIVASDASEAALEKARTGIYRERSFRSLPPALRAKYFKARGDHWQVAPELLGRVRFERANLVAHAETSELARSPIILCRNVFIYFSQEAVRRTVRNFAGYMPAGGHLFVGAAESLLKLTADFELREVGGAFVYVRKPQLAPFPGPKI